MWIKRFWEDGWPGDGICMMDRTKTAVHLSDGASGRWYLGLESIMEKESDGK